MDKQEATDHIVSKLRAGNTIEEIVDELSSIFKASPEVIMNFVNKVISDHPDALKQQSTLTNLTDWMATTPAVVENPSRESSNSLAYSDLPPGLQSIINQSNTNKNDSLADPISPISSPDKLNRPDISSDQKRTSIHQSQNGTIADNDENTLTIDLDALRKFVFQSLKKGIHQNDIVERVCEKTGWHWNKSQHFVARTKTRNHDKLQSGQNRVLILIGFGIILVGLIMTINGISVISEYAKVVPVVNTNPEALLSISPQRTIYALTTTVTGIAMIIGGLVGVTRAFIKR